MLHGVEWLGRQYSQLAKPSGPNSVEGTIATLSSRLTDKQVDMADRRASILALKSLVRDHSNAVASGAMDHLIQCLVALEPPQGNQNQNQQSGLRDEETTRAVVECLAMLCDPLVNKDDKLQPKQAKALASQHLARVDLFLSTASALHSLLPLLSPTRAFYTRFASLQLLSSLVRSRPSRVQDHVLVAPGGCGAILECLSEGTGSSAEIVRNEALLLIPLLVKDNADIQKLVAFEGAFEKLIDVVALEGRIEGGVVAQDALEGLEALLKYNVSNQNYFRETLSIPLLAPLLFYPPPPVTSSGAPSRQAEQEHARQLEAFAFQSWDSQKLVNASLVISIAGMLVAGLGEGRKSNQNAVLSSGLTKALFELSLASTAPQKLKCQALNILGHVMKNNRPNQEFLSGLMICPIVGNRSNSSGDTGFTPALNESESRQDGEASGRPSADGRASVERNQVQPNFESSGTPSAQNQATLAPLATPGVDLEEDEFEVEMNWTRLPARPAILALIGMAVNGPSSPSTPISPLKGLPMRTACLSCFSAFVADNLDVRLAILGTMMSPSDPSEESNAPLSAGAQLLQGLSSFPSSENLDPYKHLISSLLFSHLIRGSETAKKLAREISFGPDGRAVRKEEGSKPRNQAANDDDDDDDENASLIQVLVGNLTMAAREQAEAVRKARSAQVSSVTNPSSNTTSSSSSSSEPSEKDWLRVQISYLIVLCIWLFESPLSVKDLLSESANLQVLIQPVAQGGGANDALIQGLSAFILGEVYEFGPQPPQKSKSQNQDSKQNQGGGQGKKGKHGKNQSKGQNNNNDIKSPSSSSQQDEKNGDSSSNATLDREAIQPILISRIGPDTFASRLERVREDERFKEVDPEILEKVGFGNSLGGKGGKETSAALELWFDFQFVEFWKNNYVLIQRSILVDPSSTSQAVASTSTELLDAQRQAEELRETVNKQSREIELLEGRMSEMKKSMEGEIDSLKSQLSTLESSASSHPAALAELQSKLDSSASDHSKALSEVNSKHSATLQDSQENLSKSETKVKELQDQISKLEEAHLKSREEMESKLDEKSKELERRSSEKAVEPPSSSNSLSEEERKQLEELKSKKEEMEKENEDLLVLLEELSSKRKKDKAKMKEKGIEVSEDEEDDDDDEDEE